MKNPFTGKEITSRQAQLVSHMIATIEQSEPLSPTELLDKINPPPIWSEEEIKDVMDILQYNKRIQLTPNRKVVVTR